MASSAASQKIPLDQTDPEALKAWIKAQALQLGLVIVSLPNRMLKKNYHVFKEYLKRGYHGDMKFLEENLEKRADPTLLVPGTKALSVSG